MKYERQQTSPLFIALQERKKKERKQPHHIHSRADLASFFHSPKRSCTQFLERTNGNGMRQARPFHSETLNKFLATSFLFETPRAQQMLVGSAGRRFVLPLYDDSIPSAAQHCFAQTAKNVSVLLGMQQRVLFCWR